MPTPTPGPLAADASLHLLADHLVDALGDGDLEPCLLHVTDVDGTGFDLGTRPLDDHHPRDLLLGFTAPGPWHAVGLATRGWAYRCDERGETQRRRTRVHVVSIVSRTGEHAHRTVLAGERRPDLDAQTPGGEQVDLLRRTLGLATDPPPCDVSAWWAVAWLTALLDPDLPPTIGLAEAADAHPAMQLLARASLHPGAGQPRHELVDVLTAFHRVCDWSRLRALAAEGRVDAPDLAPHHARWLDDGAFARWLLNRCPPLPALRAELVGRLPTAAAEGVLDVLERLDVPEVAWPDQVPGPRPAA